MINTLLVFDEQDSDLGSFFAGCQKDLIEFLAKNEIIPEIINSLALNELTIEIKISNFQNQKFIFAAFSHGETDKLLKFGQTSYISTQSKILKQFEGSLFYTFSCLTGVELGEDLIKNGCICYIGYNNKAEIWSLNDKEDLKPFIACANFGLKQFFEGHTTQNIIIKMKEMYDYYINKIYKSNMFIAEKLMSNRDALVMYGEDIDLESFKL